MTSVVPPGEPTAPAAARTARPVADLEELLERQADDARALSGARGSAWNGKVGWFPRDGHVEPRGVVGLADWDGTIYYDRAYVQRPLQTLFERAGRGLEGHELHRAKNALAVILHENCHLLGSQPRDHETTRAAWSWPLVVLEEGATEAFSQARLNAYLRRLGLDRLVPGLQDVEAAPSYPLFVPAVQTVTQGVGRLTGQSGPQVLRKVVCEAGGKKFQTLGGIVLDGSGLAARMPAADRGAAEEEVANAVRGAFGEIARLGPFLPPETSLKLSRRVGREAMRGILAELEKLDGLYPKDGRDGITVARRRVVLPPGMARSPAGHGRAPLDAAAARVGAGLSR